MKDCAMALRVSCPEEALLWPALQSEPLPPEIARHVSGCRPCRQRMTELRYEVQLLQEMSAGSTEMEAAADQEATGVPRAVGRYPVVRRLGRGGQAEVYLALHPMLGSEVVLKLSRRTLASHAESGGGIEREARILTALSHPHLPRVLDLDVHEQRPFLVLEHVAGRSLAEVMSERRLPAIEIAEVVAKVARALHAAHEAGVLHLDLKPENVLIGPAGEVRLIDFGMAAGLEGNGAANDARWRGGTPGWMAPEQERGEASRRTDVYGLGALLEHLLQPAAPAESRQRGAPAVPSEESRESLTRRRLARIARRARSARPQERYGTARHLAEELERCDVAEGCLSRRQFVAGLLTASGLGVASWGAAMPPGENATPAGGLRIQALAPAGDNLRPLDPSHVIDCGEGVRIEVETPHPERTDLYLWLPGKCFMRLAPVDVGGAAGQTVVFPRGAGLMRFRNVTGRIAVIAGLRASRLPALHVRQPLAGVQGVFPTGGRCLAFGQEIAAVESTWSHAARTLRPMLQQAFDVYAELLLEVAPQRAELQKKTRSALEGVGFL